MFLCSQRRVLVITMYMLEIWGGGGQASHSYAHDHTACVYNQQILYCTGEDQWNRIQHAYCIEHFVSSVGYLRQGRIQDIISGGAKK